MFYLNQNDMDELFREASENYHLNTDAASDWERINHSLHEPPGIIRDPEKEKKKRRPFAFWYLLLIPLGWLGHYEWTSYVQSKQTLPKQTTHIDKADKQKEAITKNNAVILQKSIPDNTKNNYPVLVKKELTKTVFKTLQTSSSKALFLSNTSEQNQWHNNRDQNNISLNNSLQTDPLISSNAMKHAEVNTQQEKTPAINLQQPAVVNNQNITDINNNADAAAKTTIKANKKQHAIYAGLVFALDLTFIKMQHVQGIGTSYGIVGGYKINNKWSVETGVLLDQKKYYTKGAYFDKTNVAYLNNLNLISVDGECEMIEVPVNARYTFAANKKGSWSASLGVSSYFMNEEYYKYSLKINGTNEEHDHTYHIASKNFFAVANLAAGYQKNISNTLNLRLEPYLKIPLSGVGTGKLPLTSAGLTIGIIKSFPR